jgi:glutamate formiminotransferase/formiminotetrahydrofolate cyclodeaminase
MATEADKDARSHAIEDATKNAIEVPLSVMKAALGSMETIEAMATIGNPNSVSDAAVGAICARSAVLAANLNVQINVTGLTDKVAAEAYLVKGNAFEQHAIAKETAILAIARSRM